ncbi:ABC transporter substrate-binding protein [Pseudonocardia ailaonensis]|uniref:Thiamine pyrimidine synthase n=1 Tax=Pseudonocardia ailaonensis TaxID=367279 RepID=A0ABN2NHB5_9PSEU
MKVARRVAAVAVAGGLMLLAACGSGSSDQAAPGAGGTKKITVAIAAAVLGPKEEVAVISVGKQMGYYAQEGIDVETINADGSVAAVQAVASGSADITPGDTGSLLAGVQKNVPITVIGGLVQNWPWQIATLPTSTIKSAADLKGKKVGVISLASGSAPFARAVIRSGGLEPDRDVELIPVGVGAQAAAAINSGAVDALALYGQAYTVLELSGTKLAYIPNTDQFQGIRSLSFAAASSKLTADKDLYGKFLRASYKALLFSAANPKAAMTMGYQVYPQILAGQTADQRITNDTASLTAWIKSATPATGQPADWKNWGAISDADWAKTQTYTQGAGQITAPIALNKVWDPSLLTEANNFDSAAVLAQAAKGQP